MVGDLGGVTMSAITIKTKQAMCELQLNIIIMKVASIVSL